jgi:hypothetical protein
MIHKASALFFDATSLWVKILDMVLARLIGVVHQASDGGIQRRGRNEAMEVVGGEEEDCCWLFAKGTKRGGDQAQ